jgi:ATP-dependent DNA helicase RecG
MISNLISNPESKTLEFKRDLSSPRSVLRTLVAFANSAGGHLILGVADDRKIIGVENPLDEEERLSNLIADSISPRLVPSIEMITVEEKTLLVVEVFLSGMRPHFLKADGQQSGTYVRLGSTNRLADPQLIAELQRGVAGVSFDALPMPELTEDDLDLKAIAKDFEGRNSIDKRTLQSLRIMSRNKASWCRARVAYCSTASTAANTSTTPGYNAGASSATTRPISSTTSTSILRCQKPWTKSCSF